MKTGFLCFAGLVVGCLANGGGYFRGGVESTGDVTGFEPKGTEKIAIVDELLTVKLAQESADVEVRYVMRNVTDDPVKVRFGFPVEESVDQGMDESGEKVSEEDGASEVAPRYCQDYVVEAGGKALKVTWEGEPQAADDQRFKNLKGWLISELKFDSREEMVVRIRYRSGYSEEFWSVSDDSHQSAALFRYRLSTGAVWSGSIRRGRIELIPVGIVPQELRVIKPVNRFRKDGEKWVWDFENLEPTLADDLEIEAVPEVRSYGRSPDGGYEGEDWVNYIERGGKWTMSHSNYEARASSTLPGDGGLSYKATQLKNWDGAWSEGKPGVGIGEWIEVKPKVAKALKALMILPGYQKSEEHFKANARPKRIEVLLNEEFRFEADLRDAMSEQRIPVIGYGKPVRSVKLTFKEVWPGSLYEDLCVSGLQLEVGLAKKPEITPAR